MLSGRERGLLNEIKIFSYMTKKLSNKRYEHDRLSYIDEVKVIGVSVLHVGQMSKLNSRLICIKYGVRACLGL